MYCYLRISKEGDQSGMPDAFEIGEPGIHSELPALGRRSYINDILVAAESLNKLCSRTDRLLYACDRWNLSISAVKSSWDCCKVDNLSHIVSAEGLKTHPKNFEILTGLPWSHNRSRREHDSPR